MTNKHLLPETLTPDEIKILNFLYYSDEERSYCYWQIEEVVGLTKKQMQPMIKNLRYLGLVKMMRGGISEDGEVVGGTWFYIPYEERKYLKDIVGEMI